MNEHLDHRDPGEDLIFCSCWRFAAEELTMAGWYRNFLEAIVRPSRRIISNTMRIFRFLVYKYSANALLPTITLEICG